MKQTSSTHRWLTWYDQSLASPGKHVRGLSGIKPGDGMVISVRSTAP
jgi:hypothetical protein